MDLQSTFDYLMQIRKKEYAIKRKQLRCEELRSCLGARAIQYDRDRVQTSPVDKVSEIICKVADLEDQIEQLQEEKALLIIEIGDAIEQLEDDNEKTVLAEFYIGRVPMAQVAEPRSSTTASGGRTTSGSKASYIWGRRWAGIKSRQTLQKRT